jgi:hypothetical protein
MSDEMRAQTMQQMQLRPGDPRLDQIVEVEHRTAGLHVDIEIEEGPDISALQGEQFETLAGLAEKGLPIPPDAIIEASSLRNKQQLLKRMRGEDDKPNPQMQAMQQQMQQMGGMIEKLQKALADKQGELAVKVHDSARSHRKAAKQHLVARRAVARLERRRRPQEQMPPVMYRWKPWRQSAGAGRTGRKRRSAPRPSATSCASRSSAAASSRRRKASSSRKIPCSAKCSAWRTWY